MLAILHGLNVVLDHNTAMRVNAKSNPESNPSPYLNHNHNPSPNPNPYLYARPSPYPNVDESRVLECHSPCSRVIEVPEDAEEDQ